MALLEDIAVLPEIDFKVKYSQPFIDAVSSTHELAAPNIL